MTPIEYCYEKASIPGSALYFSTRQLDSLLRDAIVTICAFYKEIEDTTVYVQEPQVAVSKLTWWRKQIKNLESGKVEHPIAIMLQTLIPSFSLSPIHFIAMIDGLEQNLARPRHKNFEEVVIHIMRTAGTREFLIATLLQKNEKVCQETIYQFALVLELVNYLQNFQKYASRGLWLFSEDELNQFKVEETFLSEPSTPPGVKQLFNYQSEKIEKAYEKAMSGLTQDQKKEMSNIIIRSTIALSLLKRIQSNHYEVMRRPIELSPLHCWWIAWRTAARYA